MHECMPWIVPMRNIHIEEYFHEHIVREHVDCHQGYIGRVSVYSGQSKNDIRRSRARPDPSRRCTELPPITGPSDEKQIRVDERGVQGNNDWTKPASD